MTTPLFFFLLTALLVALLWEGGPGDTWPDWIRLLVFLLAVVFGTFALITLINWGLAQYPDRIRQINAAKVWHIQIAADAVRGLNVNQLKIVQEFGPVHLIGRDNGVDEIYWAVRTPGGAELDWSFIAEFLTVSAELDPDYLCPVRDHDKYFSAWQNSEELCQRITDYFVMRGWAEKAAGNHPAKLKVPVEKLMEMFRVV